MSLLAHIAYLQRNPAHEGIQTKFKMTHMAEIPAEGDVLGFSYNDLVKSYSARPPCLTAYVHQFQHDRGHTVGDQLTVIMVVLNKSAGMFESISVSI